MRPAVTWLITDTHFNHARIIEFGRPADYAQRLIVSMASILAPFHWEPFHFEKNQRADWWNFQPFGATLARVVLSIVRQKTESTIAIQL